MTTPPPAQQVDDWNRRMAPMVDVIVTFDDGIESPAYLVSQAFIDPPKGAVARVRLIGRNVGMRRIAAPLSHLRSMTDADRVKFGLAAKVTS